MPLIPGEFCVHRYTKSKTVAAIGWRVAREGKGKQFLGIAANSCFGPGSYSLLSPGDTRQ